MQAWSTAPRSQGGGQQYGPSQLHQTVCKGFGFVISKVALARNIYCHVLSSLLKLNDFSLKLMSMLFPKHKTYLANLKALVFSMSTEFSEVLSVVRKWKGGRKAILPLDLVEAKGGFNVTQLLEIPGSTDHNAMQMHLARGTLLKTGTLTEPVLGRLLLDIPCGEVFPASTSGNWLSIFFVSAKVTLCFPGQCCSVGWDIIPCTKGSWD